MPLVASRVEFRAATVVLSPHGLWHLIAAIEICNKEIQYNNSGIKDELRQNKKTRGCIVHMVLERHEFDYKSMPFVEYLIS